MRLRLDLAYDGTDFAGWARQPGLRTVQGLVEDALARVLRLPSSPSIVVAGRTDAGVHASGQVCHVDVPVAALAVSAARSDLGPAASVRPRLTGVLPSDVVVRAVTQAPPGFDARFSALSRRYAYRVADDPSGVSPLRRRDVVAVRGARAESGGRLGGRLDLDAMDDAARRLLGLHDFAAFCRRRKGATTVRTLLELSWRRRDDDLVEARVVADAFCHSMVRALVGAVLAVGRGRRPVAWPAQVLAAAVRDPALTVAPARGLILEEVVYPDAAGLAERARAARTRRQTPGRAPSPPVGGSSP